MKLHLGAIWTEMVEKFVIEIIIPTTNWGDISSQGSDKDTFSNSDRSALMVLRKREVAWVQNGSEAHYYATR